MSTIDIEYTGIDLSPAGQELFQKGDKHSNHPEDLKEIKLASHTLGECQAFQKKVPLSSDHIL